MIFKPNIKTERERAQNEIDDAIEAISVLDNAIACGFLKDKHSLIAQEWIKEYKNDIENCKIFLDNNKDIKWVMKIYGELWLLLSN